MLSLFPLLYGLDGLDLPVNFDGFVSGGMLVKHLVVTWWFIQDDACCQRSYAIREYLVSHATHTSMFTEHP